MPHYIILAYDSTDAEAPARRAANREAHLAGITQGVRQGIMLTGLALLNEEEKPIGSLLVVNMNTRAEVDAWLAREPYVIGKVWHDIQIIPGRLAPPFLMHAP